MGWASPHIATLQQGHDAVFIARGGSMAGKVADQSVVRVTPLGDHQLETGDIVLCTVMGCQYLHLVKAVDGDRVLIGNNKGKVNGWTPRRKVHGLLVAVRSAK